MNYNGVFPHWKKTKVLLELNPQISPCQNRFTGIGVLSYMVLEYGVYLRFYYKCTLYLSLLFLLLRVHAEQACGFISEVFVGFRKTSLLPSSEFPSQIGSDSFFCG